MNNTEAWDTINVLTRREPYDLSTADWDDLEYAYGVLDMEPPPRPVARRHLDSNARVEEYPSAEQVKMYHSLD